MRFLVKTKIFHSPDSNNDTEYETSQVFKQILLLEVPYAFSKSRLMYWALLTNVERKNWTLVQVVKRHVVSVGKPAGNNYCPSLGFFLMNPLWFPATSDTAKFIEYPLEPKLQLFQFIWYQKWSSSEKQKRNEEKGRDACQDTPFWYS